MIYIMFILKPFSEPSFTIDKGTVILEETIPFRIEMFQDSINVSSPALTFSFT